MKVLRLFAIHSYDHRYTQHNGCEVSRYKKEKISRDFPASTTIEKASLVLYGEFGPPPEAADYRFPPDQFIRVQNWTICEDTPNVGKVEEVRATQQDMFSGAELKKCLQDSPKTKRK